MYTKTIVQKGDENGNGMVVKFQLPSGLEIFSLPTKNFYGGHWDLGPTWNYAVMSDRPFLVDSGRFGQGRHLIQMMEAAGISPADIEFVLISHSHEDHDGGLSELVNQTRTGVKAHIVYDLLIRQYPEFAPSGYKKRFPAKCWHCFMPESFFKKNCLGYHEVLQSLRVERVGDGVQSIGTDVTTHHLPGHSPDSLAVMLGNDALVVGDIVLPDISPWPTRLEQYDEAAEILSPLYPDAGTLFGLERYLISLKKLRQLSEQHPDIQVFPAHRLYYQNHWNVTRLIKRVDQLIDHHIQRCAAILKIVGNDAMGVDEIARRHFKKSLLEGPGKLMAANEVISHTELMVACGDLEEVERHCYTTTGREAFESVIRL